MERVMEMERPASLPKGNGKASSGERPASVSNASAAQALAAALPVDTQPITRDAVLAAAIHVYGGELPVLRCWNRIQGWLPDTKTLDDVTYVQGSNPRHGASVSIVATMASGNEVRLEMNSDDTVRALKLRLSQETRMPYICHRLLLGDALLEPADESAISCHDGGSSELQILLTISWEHAQRAILRGDPGGREALQFLATRGVRGDEAATGVAVAAIMHSHIEVELALAIRVLGRTLAVDRALLVLATIFREPQSHSEVAWRALCQLYNDDKEVYIAEMGRMPPLLMDVAQRVVGGSSQALATTIMPEDAERMARELITSGQFCRTDNFVPLVDALIAQGSVDIAYQCLQILVWSDIWDMTQCPCVNCREQRLQFLKGKGQGGKGKPPHALVKGKGKGIVPLPRGFAKGMGKGDGSKHLNSLIKRLGALAQRRHVLAIDSIAELTRELHQEPQSMRVVAAWRQLKNILPPFVDSSPEKARKTIVTLIGVIVTHSRQDKSKRLISILGETLVPWSNNRLKSDPNGCKELMLSVTRVLIVHAPRLAWHTLRFLLQLYRSVEGDSEDSAVFRGKDNCKLCLRSEGKGGPSIIDQSNGPPLTGEVADADATNLAMALHPLWSESELVMPRGFRVLTSNVEELMSVFCSDKTLDLRALHGDYPNNLQHAASHPLLLQEIDKLDMTLDELRPLLLQNLFFCDQHGHPVDEHCKPLFVSVSWNELVKVSPELAKQEAAWAEVGDMIVALLRYTSLQLDGTAIATLCHFACRGTVASRRLAIEALTLSAPKGYLAALKAASLAAASDSAELRSEALLLLSAICRPEDLDTLRSLLLRWHDVHAERILRDIEAELQDAVAG